MKKLLLSLLLVLLLAPVVIATTFPAGTIDFRQECNDTTAYLTVAYPNTTLLVDNQTMTSQTGYANYSFTTSVSGTYNYYGACGANSFAGEFDLTPSGAERGGDNFNIFIYAIFLVSWIMCIAFFFLVIAKLVMFEETIYGVLLSWLSYFLMIMSYFLGTQYLFNSFIADMSGIGLAIFAFPNVLLALISLFVTMFKKGTDKKRPTNVREITGGLMKYG